jgi:hypothetical protein
VANTSYNIGTSINNSIVTGSPAPVLKTTAIEAGGWGGAWGGAAVTAGLYASMFSETGPGAILAGLFGAGVGGYYGRQGTSAVVDNPLKVIQSLEGSDEKSAPVPPGPHVAPFSEGFSDY